MPDTMNPSGRAEASPHSQNPDQYPEQVITPPPEYTNVHANIGHNENNGSNQSDAQDTARGDIIISDALGTTTTQYPSQMYADTEAPPPYPGPEPPPYSTSYPAPPYPGPPPSAAAAPTYPAAAAWSVPPQSDFGNKAQYHPFHQIPAHGQVPQTSQPQSIHHQDQGFRALVISTDGSRPNTWLALSVVTCLCFSPLFGLFAICFSMAAHTAYSAGDMEGARRNANGALALSFLGITLSIVMAIFIFTIY